MPDDSLLREPADRGVRLVALTLLGNARKAGGALTVADEEERDDAVHDFRVAVRRLRSWLRAFKPWVSDAVSAKRRKQLGTIADATGAARDAAVHLEWLSGERRGMGVRQRVGERWLSERLEKRRAEGLDSALSAAAQFESISAKLERRLGTYCRDVSQQEPPSLGVLVAARLVEESESLQSHLAAISGDSDVDEAHRARIAAKRLRYVVEPVAALAIESPPIIEDLKALQDSLGDLHDVHVFSQEMLMSAVEDEDASVRPGLLRLARRLEERGGRAYAIVARDWLSGAGAPFFAAVRELADDIEGHAS